MLSHAVCRAVGDAVGARCVVGRMRRIGVDVSMCERVCVCTCVCVCVTVRVCCAHLLLHLLDLLVGLLQPLQRSLVQLPQIVHLLRQLLDL